MNLGGGKQLDISWQTQEFKKICFGWTQYNEELNALEIVHTRK